MAVLARNFVHARMDTVAERNRLDDIGARQPWTLGYANRRDPQDEQQECERQHYAVHVHDESAPESAPHSTIYNHSVARVRSRHRSWIRRRARPASLESETANINSPKAAFCAIARALKFLTIRSVSFKQI
jgi:hypothetical protein